jgi:hypothetical protein
LIPEPVKIYHITSIENLHKILSCGELLSKHELQKRNMQHNNIAYENIQTKRDRWRVPCGPKGTIHDYVPWMFAPRSPMLCAIHNGRVPNVKGQDNIIYLVSTVERVIREDIPFVFTDGHATVRYTMFYDELHFLNRVNWSVMKGNNWFNTDTQPDRLRQRQAEFLVHGAFPWRMISGIGVIDEYRLELVRNVLREVAHQPPVRVVRKWYY